MKKTGILLILFFALIPLKSMAWGEKGHALVAEIAFHYLDKNTQKVVLEYLDGMSIEEAANWMDAIKKDKQYDGLKPLHYVNFEKNEWVENHCCDNIIWSLTTTINELKNYQQLSKKEVKIKICYLFHLIGDLHQPLHIGYGSDKGGNSFQLTFNSKKTNLHGLYDYGIIEYKKLKLKKCLKETNYTTQQIDAIQQGSVVNWATASRRFLDQIYNVNPQAIDANYIDANYAIIKSQLHIAGIRLAGVLKTVFSNPSN